MKGGVACMVIAAEVLADCDTPLAGDLLVNTVTDEESTGAGGLAAARLLKADAAIVPEPSSLQIAIACRGSLLLALTVEGRPGHAGTPPRHPALGGAVNAVEKMAYLIEALRRLREDWALRPPHPYLAAADCVPTVISGGEWIVSYPGRCRLECHVEYLPTDGGGDPAPQVRREVEDWIARAAAADAWLREHPPAVDWLPGSVPPAQVSPEEPIVQTLIGAERAAGRSGRISGFDNWHDGAWLILEAGIPTVCFGPRGLSVAHTVDEHVPIADLVSVRKPSHLRLCGSAASRTLRRCEPVSPARLRGTRARALLAARFRSARSPPDRRSAAARAGSRDSPDRQPGRSVARARAPASGLR